MAKRMSVSRRAREALDLCEREYGPRRAFLHHDTPFQLLVAVVLSAQTRDATVNEVTPALFARFPDATALARATPVEVDRLIAKVGFHRTKAPRIIDLAHRLVEEHDGEVPRDFDALTSLPGVGRKTANVVLGHLGQPPGVGVDTHVARVSRRLALTRAKAVDGVADDLEVAVPPERWASLNYLFIRHGRAVCQARKPMCGICPLDDLCPKVGIEKAWVAESRRLAAQGRLHAAPDATLDRARA